MSSIRLKASQMVYVVLFFLLWCEVFFHVVISGRQSRHVNDLERMRELVGLHIRVRRKETKHVTNFRHVLFVQLFGIPS